MRERVRALDVGIVWEPNVPLAMLATSDDGTARLSLAAHPDDEDQRRVHLLWSGVQASRFGPPNNEGIHAHPLYGEGLREVRWLGVVEDSTWRQAQAEMVHLVAERHYVVVTKEALVGVG